MKNSHLYTDLALECTPRDGHMPGVHVETRRYSHASLTRIEIATDDAAKSLGRAKGTYITLTMPSLYQLEENEYQSARLLLKDQLSSLIPSGTAPLLVVGLGNPTTPPDSFGVRAARQILPFGKNGEQLACVFTPDVKENSGMDSADVVAAITNSREFRCILVLDSLLARNRDNLLKCIQLSSTGIVPGSGVSSHRKKICQETMGIPVVSVGVPTTLRWDSAGKPPLYVCPQDVKEGVRGASLLVSDSVHSLFYP